MKKKVKDRGGWENRKTKDIKRSRKRVMPTLNRRERSPQWGRRLEKHPHLERRLEAVAWWYVIHARAWERAENDVLLDVDLASKQQIAITSGILNACAQHTDQLNANKGTCSHLIKSILCCARRQREQ